MKTHFTNFVERFVSSAIVATGLLLSQSPVHAGALSGVYEVIASASTINLTAEGTIDWAHWGRTSPADFNHRAGVAQQISNFTLIGQGPILQFGDNFTGYSWTNGTRPEPRAALPASTSITTTTASKSRCLPIPP